MCSWYFPSWFAHSSFPLSAGPKLPDREKNVLFSCFLASIFYVGQGRGQGARMLEEVRAAQDLKNQHHHSPLSRRIRHILTRPENDDLDGLMHGQLDDDRMFRTVTQVCSISRSYQNVSSLQVMEGVLLHALQRLGKVMWKKSVRLTYKGEFEGPTATLLDGSVLCNQVSPNKDLLARLSKSDQKLVAAQTTSCLSSSARIGTAMNTPLRSLKLLSERIRPEGGRGIRRL